MRPSIPILSGLGVVLVGVIGAAFVLVNREDAAVARGSILYDAHCASCHGQNLEGQPDWQKPGSDGRYPAPPHDASGHTWHHSDTDLIAYTASGWISLPVFLETCGSTKPQWVF